MKQKIEDPLTSLEKDINKLEGNIQRSGKIMSSMQNTVDKLKFEGHKPIPPVKNQDDAALVRRPDMQSNEVDDGCVFSGTASGKSANVKVGKGWCTTELISDIVYIFNRKHPVRKHLLKAILHL